jgi:hypothetical protein
LKITFFILVLLGAIQASGQSVTQQDLYWLRYQNQWSISPTLYWTNEGENRRFFSPDVENQLILHSHLHYKYRTWDFGVGLTLSWIYAQFPEAGFDHTTSEIRPFIEVAREHKLGKVFFQNKIRIDNRFLQSNSERSLWAESIYVTRLRYRAQLRLVLKQKESTTVIGARIADEIMFNSKYNIFDQNRIYASVDILAWKGFTIEPSYVHVYQQRFRRDDFFSRHIFRLSIIHRV